MYIDIVFPDKNEKEFVLLAEELGYNGICFVYDFGKVPGLKLDTKLEVFTGVVVKNEKEVRKARGVSDIVLYKATDKARHFVESRFIDVVFDFEQLARKDKVHYRASGFNQVLAKLMKEKNIAYGVSFNSILNAKDRSLVLGRVMQNIVFARKFRFPMLFASFAKKPMEMRSCHDLIGFLISLGAHPTEAKNALKQAYEVIKLNRFKKSSKYVREGVELE